MTKKSTFLFALGLVFGAYTAFGQCSDIFISEYLEGSSNNKALEIYNPTDVTVDLSNYEFYRFNNGATVAGDSLQIPDTLAAGAVYVIANPSSDPIILAQGDTTHTMTFYNGDDVIMLVNHLTGDTVDVVGQLGVDPGVNWPVGAGATSEFTLVRMASVTEGNNDWTLGATQWLVFPQNTFDSLGAHTIIPCSITPPGGDSTGCTTDIFFSEYLEGSSNNKAIEIFNPSDSAVNLGNYEIYRFNNGATAASDSLVISESLAPGAVYVIANPSSDTTILAEADTTHTITFYNGDDVMMLVNHFTGDTIDVIGQLGVDPGVNWPVGAGATSEFTLVRMPSINEGTNDWAVGATQWLTFPQNTFDSLGAHYMIPCNAPAPDSPSVSFAPTSANFAEGAGTVGFDVTIANSGADTVAVDVVFDAVASTATLGVDFTWNDTTIVFPANATTPISLSVTLIDDGDVEANETIVVNLVNVSSGSLIAAGTFTLTVTDNDYIEYPIGLITADADGDGQTDSLGVKCEVRGIVHGVDLQGGTNPAILFTVIDSTGGIAVFSSNNFGYVVTEGDEVIVQGTVGSFNGLAEFTPPDNVILVSQGNPTVTPMVVTTLDEVSENELVTIECLTMINPSQWPSTVGGSVNIDMTNGVDTFVIRIDSDVDINGSPAPTGKWLTVTGLGGQFDSSSPYNNGYQLLPRYIADVVENPDPVVGFDEAAISVDESVGNVAVSLSQADGNPDTTVVTVSVDASSTATDGTDFTLSGTAVSLAGCGADSAGLTVTVVDDSDVEGNETIVLVITSVTNNASVVTDTVVITLTETDAIADLLPAAAIRLYPNPAQETIFWNSDYRIEKMIITNLLGQEVVNKINPETSGSMEITTLPDGVYIIRMQTTEGLWMQKWVKK